MNAAELVKEINNLEYECERLLLQEYANVTDDKITSNQIIILNYVQEKGKIITGELPPLLGISPSAISQILNKMERMELIKREINPKNRREVFVALDHAGKKYLKVNDEIENSIIDRFYSKLPMEDLQTLKRIYTKFNQIIKDEIMKDRGEHNL